MKNLFKILLLLITCLAISSSAFSLDYLKVEYKNTPDTDDLSVKYINEVPYFNILELNRLFNAHISEDLIDRRIFVELYDQRLIFLFDSSYLLFHSELYNFTYDHLYIDGKHYLPLLFIKEVLPILLPDKIVYDSRTHTLRAELAKASTKRTIVLDPGHGGKDPGAVGFTGKTFEKDISLTIAKQIKGMVEERLPDVKVLLTREDDRFISLQQRTTFANKNQADLFISIHCNAAYNKAAHGIEVFFLSAAKSDEARAVEALENSVVEKYEGGIEALKKYDDLNFILMDMAQAEQLQESSHLAIKLQANLIKSTGAHNRTIKQAGFYVLRGAFMPAVLVELGFITNKEEEQKLKDANYQNKLAEAVFEGIKGFVNNYDMYR